MVNLRMWWEDVLTNSDRTMLMKAINYDGWEGSTEDRHEKLEEMYIKWQKLRDVNVLEGEA